MPPKNRAKRTVAGVMWDGFARRRDSVGRGCVIRGKVKRFRVASRRKAKRIVLPFFEGSGVIGGFVAGDLEEDILDTPGRVEVLGSRVVLK
jgi:hypothetical protein